jgi:hypothetical protein
VAYTLNLISISQPSGKGGWNGRTEPSGKASIKKTVLFIITSKRIKYSGKISTKEANDV